MKILYYISGHGYGHMSRSYEIIRNLVESPVIEKITISSKRVNFVSNPSPKIDLREIGIDVGIIQNSSISMDIMETKNHLEEFEKQKDALIRSEAKFLREGDYDLVISDSSSLAFVIAIEAEIPSLFVGNFTWDFIYRNLEKHHPYFGVIADLIQVEYSFANAALILPFACHMDHFLESKKIGLVGRRPELEKKSARNHFGFEDGLQYFLFSFGAYGIDSSTWNWSNIPSNWRIVCSDLPGIHSDQIIDIKNAYYPNLVTACDYVVTKPGYGIISECVYANTPIIYTDRGEFAEYNCLVDSLKTEHPSSFISQEKLRQFDFGESIETIKNWKQNASLNFDGERDVLEFILNRFS
ncbi:glycosyltransferase family protein [Leptospira sp. GIMC2001]|uniref:glycosyltransferase family protein n=1 Tax=Leptospira sp. GIMC2001 TaxID=1513297 RepID=UPI00234B2C0F|nr:glycosyltransferase family protein [Leptospira sp. GIMC2001]WCL50512.1 glycosyl transferase [Leptospira sp. GIMC2001]